MGGERIVDVDVEGDDSGPGERADEGSYGNPVKSLVIVTGGDDAVTTASGGERNPPDTLGTDVAVIVFDETFDTFFSTGDETMTASLRGVGVGVIEEVVVVRDDGESTCTIGCSGWRSASAEWK